MTRISAFLLATTIVLAVVCAGLWLDNRALAQLAVNRSEKEWVRPETLGKFADVCEQLAWVNRRDQAMLGFVKNTMEEIDGIRQYNEDSRSGPGAGGRQRGHGEVRRVARHADEGSHGRSRAASEEEGL